ncbi:MAG: hypothetical protein HY736_20915 [Verrucomicrobia bacterium]|nr:hypothetical protein [Verrucomicrobiota bacterium]
MPAAEFELRVDFRDFVAGKGAFSPYEIRSLNNVAGVDLHVGHYQKPGEARPTTVRISVDQAVLQFKIVGLDGNVGAYHPIGIGFTRADGTRPNGIPFTTADRRLTGSPFKAVRMNERGSTIEITSARIKDLPSIDKTNKKARTHTTYRFVVFIQETETGLYGVIDPEIENPN